jgi:hypothetical protein
VNERRNIDMNKDNDKQKATDIDPQVSDYYASLADEKTPVDLDRAVLREATRALRADNRKGSFGAWFRPVAFMAMVGLSIAIILDLSDTNIFDPPADISPDTAPSAPARPASKNAADATTRDRSQPTFSEFKRQEKAAAARNTNADAPAGASDDESASTPPAALIEAPRPERGKLLPLQSAPLPVDSRRKAEPSEDYSEARDALTAEAESAAQRVRKLEATADANRPSQPATAVQSSIATLSLATPLHCSDEQKTDAKAWWICIETLRESGQIEAAASELENLRKNFPDFAPPE